MYPRFKHLLYISIVCSKVSCQTELSEAVFVINDDIMEVFVDLCEIVGLNDEPAAAVNWI